ncbi:monovalent cation/H+ antiporter complex subunit F [Agrococcus sp. SGAir0287]|uniref:monovalent cation/H+ antiporter complex subunit F n=1 Tax=Agrococcus sp. SGAir0287 TaxID=2070347 RepID=UPI0020C7D0A1|nr:monovalent cation/H+ antiporter complex subunit F [Agrococcus sp. SGAir0287]
MSDWVLVVAGVLLAAAAVMAIVRLVRGPSPIDRVLATDVLIAVVVGVLAIEAAVSQHAYTVPVMLVLSLVAFAGTVAMARYVASRAATMRTDEEDDA